MTQLPALRDRRSLVLQALPLLDLLALRSLGLQGAPQQVQQVPLVHQSLVLQALPLLDPLVLGSLGLRGLLQQAQQVLPGLRLPGLQEMLQQG